MSVAMWIIWLFWMGSHYIHSSVNQRSAVTGSFQWGSIIWQFQMGSHYRHLSANQWSAVNDSFKWGRTLAKEGSSAKFELISGFTLASQRSFLWKTNEKHPSICYNLFYDEVNFQQNLHRCACLFWKQAEIIYFFL